MKRIAKNTSVMFARQIVMVLINLYTIRLLLQSLGVIDFGLMNVTLSVVMLLSFVNGSLGMVTQRFLAYALGEKSNIKLKRYHDTCLVLLLCSASFIFLILQTLGLWFVNNEMAIEPGRYEAVTTLYQFLVLYVIVGAFTTFHSSVMIAHEDMHIFAIFSILQAVLRLGAALLIGNAGFDNLVEYGFFILCAVSMGTLSQWIYCACHYEECAPGRIKLDPATLREMIGFTRWTLFGQLTTVCRTQAITLLINQAFNPTTVAARALSFTIYTQVQTFSQNFTSTLNPPIIKSYASGDRTQTFSLIIFGSKLAFFLSWIVTLPLISLLPGILEIWLGIYPEDAVLFTRLALVEGLILSISFPLMAAVRAAGDLRAYEMILGGLQVLVLIVSWLLVSNGFAAYWIFIVAIIVNIVMFFVRLGLASKLIGLAWRTYLHKVMMPVGLVMGSSAIFVVLLMLAVPGSSMLDTSSTSLGAALTIILSAPICVFALGLSYAEREAFSRMVLARIGNRKQITK